MNGEVETCEWTFEEYIGWNTTCSNLFFFEDDGPMKNGFAYCPFCGKPLVETDYVEEDEEG